MGMKAQQVSPDAATYATLALPYAKRGDIERVEELMHQSRAAGHVRREREYSRLLSAYANAYPRDHTRAERVFREMIASGIKPNGHIFRFLRLAMGFARANDLVQDLGFPAMQRPSGLQSTSR